MTSGRIAALIGAFATVILLVWFALVNRGQSVVLDFGIWSWQGDAVYAIYAGICVGLIVMFIVSLPGDLAIRREHRRLAHRDREMAVRRGTDPADPRP